MLHYQIHVFVIYFNVILRNCIINIILWCLGMVNIFIFLQPMRGEVRCFRRHKWKRDCCWLLFLYKMGGTSKGITIKGVWISYFFSRNKICCITIKLNESHTEYTLNWASSFLSNIYDIPFHFINFSSVSFCEYFIPVFSVGLWG